MSRKPAFFLTVSLLVFGVVIHSISASDTPGKRLKRQVPLRIKAVAWGRSQAEIEAAKARIETSSDLRSLVAGAKYRFISFEFLERTDKSGRSLPPDHFRAIYYDYSNDRTLVAVGDFDRKEPIIVRQAAFQPIASQGEFDDAVRVLANDPTFAGQIKSGQLAPYPPMPDVTVLDGTVERLVNVGLAPKGSRENSEIVSVSLGREKVIRYDTGAPPDSTAAPESCGIASAGQASTARGVAGQVELSVVVGQVTLWEMLVIRPSASTGTRASGIELRDVKYKGKSVLKRAHAPILNVQYIPQTCGPYRDWQYAEGFFNAPTAGANDVAPGIRILAAGQVATTALETGIDTGNFQGVAIYLENGEAILVTEMDAGWYRYIMEWRFANDGTIRPRFGFGATKNSCVCNVHNHHVYWRFDFDIVQPTNKVFRVERGRKFRVPILTEKSQLRNVSTNRSLLIKNSAGNEAYELVPNIFDGVTDSFGVSDMWLLRYKNVVGGTAVQNELDDGINCTTCASAFIQIDQFLTNESVVDQDVVVWYGAHFRHEDGVNLLDPNRSPEHLTGSHVVGPDLRPVLW